MKKYILCERTRDDASSAEPFLASGKAARDVYATASAKGYEPLYITRWTLKSSAVAHALNQVLVLGSWLRACRTVQSGDILLIQCPIHRRQTGRNFAQHYLQRKGSHIVSLIHDVEALRGAGDEFHTKEFGTTVMTSDVLIVHNDKMEEYFLSIGVAPKKLVKLQIFDYLFETEERNKGLPKKAVDAIVLAGNCSAAKAPYLARLGEIDWPFELYGPNYEDTGATNVHYNGKVDPDLLPARLNGKFGLVWDGPVLETCTGKTGNYLRYNNPHKTSLYLASGLPVLIWSGAALAPFITENHLGVAVESLLDAPAVLGALSDDEYLSMKAAVLNMAYKLHTGYFTSTALDAAEALCK